MSVQFGELAEEAREGSDGLEVSLRRLRSEFSASHSEWLQEQLANGSSPGVLPPSWVESDGHEMV